jgi:SAM-dependent methyltransferase
LVRQILERFFAVTREQGVAAAIAGVASFARRTLRHTRRDAFDATLGTDTSSEVSLWRLKISSDNAKFGVKYQTLDPSLFLSALKMVPDDPEDLTFIDLGCGKGRTLILAGKCGFKRVIGVEFSPDLSAIARANISKVGVCAEIVETDVAQFTYPNDNLLIYMYNPFGESVMRSVIQTLHNWHDCIGKQAYVMYFNPVYHRLFDRFPAFELASSADAVKIWRLRDFATGV